MVEHRTDGSDTNEASREYCLQQLGKEIDRLMQELRDWTPPTGDSDET